MKYYAQVGGEDYEIYLEEKQGGLWVRIGDRLIQADWASGDADAGFFNLILNGVSYDVTAERMRDTFYVTIEGEGYTVDVEDERTHHVRSVSGADSASAGGPVRSVMPGMILKILVAQGDAVEVDTPLAVMEAMKMENEIKSPFSGIVQKISIEEGVSIGGGEEMFFIAPHPDA